jgi:hypothetical protein
MNRARQSLESMEGLSIRQLDTVTGGAATWAVGGDGKKKTADDIGGECADMAAEAIPQAEVPHTVGVGASATSGGGQASASASAQVGTSETTHMGGVTVTTYAGASAQAQAQVGPLGAQAGASVSGGFGNHFDLGKGVEIVTEAKGFAGLGVAVGIIDNHLAAGGDAAAGVSSTISQKYTSVEFGDGATVTETAHVEAGAKAHAGGGVEIGADGVHTGYESKAGFYAEAQAGVEIGNDSYSGGGSVKAISPGNVSVGTNVGADFEDGQLKLNLSGEMSAIFGGFGYEVSVGVQLLDSASAKGSPEEIQQAFGELMEHMATEDAQLTDAWQHQLEADVHHYEQMIQPLQSHLHEAERELSRYEEERQHRADDIAAFNTAAMLKDFQDNMGLEQGAKEWGDHLSRMQEDLTHFDKDNAPRVADLNSHIETYHQELDARQEVVDSLKAQLEVAHKGDADNISRLEKEQFEAVNQVNNFIHANESQLVYAQTELERIQDRHDDMAAKVIALEILSGEHGSYSGTAEFRDQVTKELTFLKENHMDPQRVHETLDDMRHRLADFDQENERPVKELQDRVNVLGKEFVAAMDEFKSVQAELAEARSSTYMAQRAQAELSIQDEEREVHVLASQEHELALQMSQLQRQVGEESSHLSRMEKEHDRRGPELESNIDRELAEFKSAAQAHGDTLALNQIARFEEVRRSGNLTPDSFRGADIGPLQHMGQDILRYQEDGRMLAERQGRLETLTHQLAAQETALAETRHDLAGAQDRYEAAKDQADKHDPLHAAQERAEAMQERTNALEKMLGTATGENRRIIQDQIMAQRELQRDLNMNAEMTERMLEEARDRFDDRYRDLQNTYDDLRGIEIKRGVLGYVAEGAGEVWSAISSIF